MMGNIFEWYDFALFGYFAPIIGSLFFPTSNKTTQLLSAFAAFAIGYVFRPLGGLFFGYIGDRYGRKKALVLTIFLMAFPTTLIGLLPDYNQIGITASIILVVLRILQGISMGGNYGGSITFTTEHAKKNKGLIGSFATTSCLIGILLGSSTAAFFTHFLSEGDLHSYGWRIPFLLGVSIFFVGFYMRNNLSESSEFTSEEKKGTIHHNPPLEVLRNHKKDLISVVGVVMLHDLSFYILFVYMTTYLSEVVGLAKDMSFIINSLNLIIVSMMTLGGAWLSDKIGRKKVLAISALFFVLATIPLIKLINDTTNIQTVFIAQMLLAIAVGGYFGPIPALMVEAYPISIRFSAVSITTNISGPLFGGTAPMVITYLIDATGSTLIPAFYLTLGALGSLIALKFVKVLPTLEKKGHKSEVKEIL